MDSFQRGRQTDHRAAAKRLTRRLTPTLRDAIDLLPTPDLMIAEPLREIPHQTTRLADMDRQRG